MSKSMQPSEGFEEGQEGYDPARQEEERAEESEEEGGTQHSDEEAAGRVEHVGRSRREAAGPAGG